ncbi:MAG: HemK2/MTQ2 family protein methyltransferase [Candidatus Saliniplasma sp.]
MEILSELDYDVNEGVYAPSDDSFLLIELLELNGDERVLEIGCGSGLISLHCASKGCETTAVDVSETAVENTFHNAERNGLKIDAKLSDMFTELSSQWDVIIFNPPYLPNEQNLARDIRWDGGERGDETILDFLSQAPDFLIDEGLVYLIYSDRAPVDRIHKVIEGRYTLQEKLSETFSFETIYAIKLFYQSK